MSCRSIASLFALASLLFPVQQHAQQTGSGPLDLSFGSGGKVTTDLGLGIPGSARAVIIQPDGKILTAGRAGTRSALLRYNNDGSLDSSFGTGGKVFTEFFGHGDQANAVLLQPDGKIVAAGSARNEFALARYNADGSLDSSFGVEGRVTTGFINRWAVVKSIGLLPNGKIVAAGGVITTDPNSIDAGGDFALARYHKDGRLDASFGVEGRLTTDFFGGEDDASALIVQPNRKVVAIGYAQRQGEKSGLLAAVRYNLNGSLDSSFGNNGKVTIDFMGRGGRANAGILQPDGKLVLAGYVSAGNDLVFDVDFVMVRLNPDGNPDTAFGDGGIVSIDFFNNTDYANAIAIQRNGKIVLGGFVFDQTAGGDFGIARVNSDGTVDLSFGDGGKTTIDFFHFSDEVQGIAIQDDGKIVVAGSAQGIYPEVDLDVGLARFESSRPIVASASASGKRLLIRGTGFDDDAKILVNGKEQNTANDAQNPATSLVAKKAGREIKFGDKIRVLNTDGALSAEFIFTG